MPSSNPFKIVVIEDSLQTLEMIKDYLQDKFTDAVIKQYRNGENALEEMNASPDLVILDYYLDSENPKALNGLQVFMEIKKRFDVPVVFLSGQEKSEVSASIIKYGAYDYVEKNQDSFHRLEIIIYNILANRQIKKDLQSQQSSTKALIVIVVAIVAAIVLMKVIG